MSRSKKRRAVVRLADEIITLRGPSLDIETETVVERTEDGGSKSWVKVFPLGMTIVYRGEPITFTRKLLTEFVAKFRSEGISLNANYGHIEDEPVEPEAKISAGDVLDVQLREDGFWALVHWTARAARLIRAREMKRISGELHPNYTDKYTGKKVGPKFLALALTNRPFIDREMPRVAASELTAEGDSHTGVDGTQGHESGEEKMHKRIHEALKLSEKATEEEVAEAIAKLAETKVKCPMCGESVHGECEGCGKKFAEQAKELEAAKLKLSEAEAKARQSGDQVAQLAERVTKAETKLAETEKRSREDDAKRFVDDLRNRRLITPAQYETTRAWAMADRATCEKFFEKATPVVPEGPAGHDHQEDKGDKSPLVKLNDRALELMEKEKISDFRVAFAKAAEEDPKTYAELSEAYRPQNNVAIPRANGGLMRPS